MQKMQLIFLNKPKAGRHFLHLTVFIPFVNTCYQCITAIFRNNACINKQLTFSASWFFHHPVPGKVPVFSESFFKEKKSRNS